MSVVAKSTKVYSGFAPTQIPGCALWLDAGDQSTLTLSGSSVTTWADKSGNGGNATQSTSGNRPTFVGSGVVFNAGSSQWLQLNTPFASTHSIFIVATPTSATNVYLFGRNYIGGGGGSPSIIMNYTGTSLEYYSGNDGSTRSTYGSPTSTFIAGYIRTYGSSVFGRLNGTQIFSAGGPTSEPSSIAWGALGQSSISTNYYTGTIYEFMIFNTALTTSQAQQIEGYLAQKWGLASIMPASHPFGASIAPSPQSFSPRDIDGCALWLDAADPATMSLSGSNVTQWRDKSPSGWNLSQSTSGNRPSYDSAKRSVYFTGSNLNYIENTAININLGTASLFVVVDQPILDKSYKGVVSFRGASSTADNEGTDGAVLDNGGPSDTFLHGFAMGGGGPYILYGSTATSTTPYIIQVTNGSLVATPAFNASTFTAQSFPTRSTTTRVRLGARTLSDYAAVGGYTGNYYEVILYSSAITASQRQQVEGYLAWKWGLIPNIPSPHPYKLALPYVRQFSPRDVAGCALWLDAADSSTITLSGNNVTQWSDKSGTANNAVPGSFGALGPTRTTSNSLLFTRTSSSTQYLRTQTGRQTTIPATFFLVVKSFNDNSEGVFFDVRKGTGPPLYTLYSRQALARGATGSNITAYPYTFPSSFTIVCFRANTNLFQMFINGTQQVNGTAALDMPAADSGWTTIGALADTIGTYSNQIVYTASSEMSEIMMYNAFLTDTQRQQVEGYLAWKWNLTSNLPAAHPFEDKPPYAQPFLPTNIAGCSMWLDAADAGSVTLSGSNVTQWSDKSGNGRNAVVSSTAFATYSNSGLYFANSLYTTTLSASPTNETLFLVFNNTSSSNTGAIIGAYNGGREIANYDSNRTVGIVKAQIVWGPYANFPAFNAKYMAACIVSPTATKVIVNGGTSITTGSAITFSSSSNTILGREAGVDFGVTGIMHEVISFNSVLSDTQRQQVEGYLAWKWGLTPFLSVGHPFKYSAPSYYIPPFAPTDLAGCALWLDAADSSSLTLSGSSVTAWADKSANGYSFTGTAGNYPVVSNSSINGLPTLSFTGTGSSSQYLSCLPFVLSNANYSIFTVVRQNASAPSTYGFNYVLALPVANARLAFGSLDYKFSTFTGSGTTWNDVTSNTPALVVTSRTLLLEMIVNGSVLTPYYNGIAMNTKVGTTGSFTGLRVGDSIDGFTGQCWGGLIAEIVIYNTALTTTQRQMVENYLAWKWGLNQSLVARPNVRPLPLYTRPINPLDIAGCQLWLDAADSTTITASGSNVSAWRDKASGLTFSNSGTVTYTESSKTMNFTGTNVLTNATGVSTSVGVNQFVVWSSPVGATRQRIFQQTYSGQYAFGIIDTNFMQNLYSASVGYYVGPLTYSTSTPYLYSVNTRSGSGFTYSVNGVESSTWTSAYTPGAQSTSLFVGGNSLFPFTGSVMEVIHYDAFLTVAQTQQVEGYLAHKWKLTSSVPTSHPFKRFPSLMTTFAPPQLSGLSLWFDAADPSTRTLSGSNVTLWRDKVSNIPATPNSTATLGTFNGNPIIQIPAGSEMRFTASFSGQSRSWFMVMRNDTQLSASIVPFGLIHGYNTGDEQLTITYGTPYVFYHNVGGLTGVASANTTNPFNILQVYSAIASSASTSSNIIGISGSPLTLLTNNLASGMATTQLFTMSRADFNSAVTVCEVIAYNTAVTTSQRQQVEGYLAWKWGLVGNLPSTHPYKKFTP